MSAQYNSEYTKATVASSKCQYASLGCYYGPNSTSTALRPGTVSGKMVVPGYGAIGYNALTHGKVGCCGSHFNIQDAYGSSCSANYTTKLCGGCGGGGGGGGKGQGWKCDTSTGRCMNAPLGAQGVFGNAWDCQGKCKKSA